MANISIGLLNLPLRYRKMFNAVNKSGIVLIVMVLGMS